MANPGISELVTTTLANRSRKIADNVTKNNALLFTLKEKGNIRPFSGGRTIYEEMSYAENSNFGWYSGYEELPTAAQDVLTSAEFSIKQAAVSVPISGLEEIQNNGREAVHDLLAQRMKVAEATMKNKIDLALHSDGTGGGGKEITGLEAAVPTDPTAGVYGGISRVDYTFWRPGLNDVTLSADNIYAEMLELWTELVRGADRPDLILAGSTAYKLFSQSLQGQQRFTNAKLADAGFTNIAFEGVPVVLDGGIGGNGVSTDMFFLNTSYLHWRPVRGRDMVPLKKRTPVNQDAEVSILVWAGNLTCSGQQFHGRITGG